MTAFKLTRSLAAALLLAAGAAQAESKVVMGQIAISFYAVTGQVVQAVLERLGHEVEVKTGSHGQIFPVLGKGEVDLLVAAWLPHAHSGYWQEYGSQSVELGKLYEGAQLFWAVPHYIPASAVSSVEDLKKPDVARRMTQTIRGTGPDSGLMIGSRKIMQAYALENAGYELVPGAHQDWHDYFEQNYNKQRWFVMPYFRPNYLNRIADMRMIEEQHEFLGGPNSGTLVAHRNFIARAPDRTVEVLGRIELGLEAVAEMDYMVRIDGMTPRDAAHMWMSRNAGRVDRWFD
ncbi:MAG TPA: glycine betaine ABC transporter substrate-binding protein [Burkholderiales bacterium]|nr:glycine betaine ABC transporter substrate-binding protein [Burkholderiales bacterium]